ncbi:MAG: hypothetical protein ABIH70_04480 [Chloroflexota bacterium]
MFKKITPNNVLKYLDHVMNFQLNDLRKASILATANFLVAIGCMGTIEFLGGISNEKIGKPESKYVSCRFKDGVRLLKGEYITPPLNEDIMYDLRNSLTHQYLVTGGKKANFRDVIIKNSWTDSRAVLKRKNRLTLNVAKLIIDLSIAWGILREQLEKDGVKRANIARILNTLPILQ